MTPFSRKLKPEIRKTMSYEHKNDLIALPFTLGWQISLFLLPMQLIIHSFDAFKITLVIFIICLSGMYWFWYRNLPEKGKAFSDQDNRMAEDIFQTVSENSKE